jgi:hypothetical protein
MGNGSGIDCHALFIGKFHDGDALATLAIITRPERFDQWMPAEFAPHGLPKFSCSLAVDNENPDQPGHIDVMEKLIELRKRFIQSHVPEVKFM